MAALNLVRNNFYRIIIFVVIIVLFFVPVPTNNLWWREAGNSSHTILFFILSFLLYQLISSLRSGTNQAVDYFIVLALGLALGALIEILQSFTQREASLNDVYRDLSGIVASLCFIAIINLKDVNRQKLKLVLYLSTGITFILIGLMPIFQLSWHYMERDKAFPVIVDLDTDWSSSFIRFNNAELIESPGTNKEKKDGLSLIRFGRGGYPGISVIEPVSDWTSYHKLHIKIYSMYERNINLVLRVHDKEHNQDYADRFNKRLPVKPGLNDFEIALLDIRNGPVDRLLDLKNIAGLILFSSEQQDEL